MGITAETKCPDCFTSGQTPSADQRAWGDRETFQPQKGPQRELFRYLSKVLSRKKYDGR